MHMKHKFIVIYVRCDVPRQTNAKLKGSVNVLTPKKDLSLTHEYPMRVPNILLLKNLLASVKLLVTFFGAHLILTLQRLM